MSTENRVDYKELVEVQNEVTETVLFNLQKKREGSAFDDRIFVPLSPSELEFLIGLLEKHILEQDSITSVSVCMDYLKKLKACLFRYRQLRDKFGNKGSFPRRR